MIQYQASQTMFTLLGDGEVLLATRLYMGKLYSLRIGVGSILDFMKKSENIDNMSSDDFKLFSESQEPSDG